MNPGHGFAAAFARALGKQTVVDDVVKRAYMREDNKVKPIDAQAVAMVAQSMEAMLVMADEMPNGALMNVSCTKHELNSFVCYMRELDSQYRVMEAKAETYQRELEKIKEVEKDRLARDARPARSPTAESYPDWAARELVKEQPGYLSLAKGPSKKQRGGHLLVGAKKRGRK